MKKETIFEKELGTEKELEFRRKKMRISKNICYLGIGFILIYSCLFIVMLLDTLRFGTEVAFVILYLYIFCLVLFINVVYNRRKEYKRQQHMFSSLKEALE